MNDVKRYDNIPAQLRKFANAFVAGSPSETLLCDAAEHMGNLAAANARIEALKQALQSVKSVLDGVEHWDSGDVLANALCAYSIADDALAATPPDQAAECGE